MEVKKAGLIPLRNKVAYLGVFLALALICSYVESLIPFYFGIPGVKLGLTNIVVVLLLYCVGTREALTVSVLRILLAGFLFGNMFQFEFVKILFFSASKWQGRPSTAPVRRTWRRPSADTREQR